MRSKGSMITVAVLLSVGSADRIELKSSAQATTATGNVAVGPQYDSAHVYVAPGDFDRFVASFLATFGGTTSKQGVFTVTPTPSSTLSQMVSTPVGILSVFGYQTPSPIPLAASVPDTW